MVRFMLPFVHMFHTTFGKYQAQLNLGDAQTRVCPTCGQSTKHAYYLQYTFEAFYRSFGWVTSRTYGCICERCKKGPIITRSDLPLPIAQSEPIRFLHRHGAIFLGAAGLGGALLLCWILMTFAIK
jgi:hypothetical protein